MALTVGTRLGHYDVTATGLEWSGPLTGRNCSVQRAADTPLESMPPGE